MRELHTKRSTYEPYLSTVLLPPILVGESFEIDIFGSLVGDKVPLEITADNIPDGFALSNCTMKYNIEALDKPNSVVNCTLSGKSDVELIQDIEFQISAKEYYTSSTKALTLRVLNEIPN